MTLDISVPEKLKTKENIIVLDTSRKMNSYQYGLEKKE